MCPFPTPRHLATVAVVSSPLCRCVRIVALVCVCVAALPLVACESTTVPTAPSGGLQLTASASTLPAGDTTTVTVAGAASGTAATALTWTSSDGSVASVSGTGVVTARRAGTAIITARTSAASGQVTIRVVSRYAGTWTGGLSRAQPSCAPASAAPVCVPTTPPTVLQAPVTLVLTQTGAMVTGTLTDALEPQHVVPVQGTVDASDALTLEGASVVLPAPAPQRRLTVTTFRATWDPTLGTMSGSYRMVVERASATGALEFEYAIQAQFRDLPGR